MLRLTPFLLAATLSAADLNHAALTREFAAIAADFDGRVGACADFRGVTTCVPGSGRFSIQSVMKLLVGAAVLDRVDRQGGKTGDPITVHRTDLSVFHQPIAELIGPKGYPTTIGDLVRRAIIDSDSAAADILAARMGGIGRVQAFLDRHRVAGVRIDRNERDLQTETVGLTWRPEFVDAAVLASAIKAVPEAMRDRAWEAYRRDPRDTATPEGMARFLSRLAAGELLSPSSTAFLLKAMDDCATFPDRLKAGLGAGWSLGHKTGSSGTWKGLTAATNDTGVMTAPDGARIGIAVFLADSRATLAVRNKTAARIAAAVVANYR
ncbi:MAG: class A beta-lactamase [Acidobacteria bacterium]|nr:class A beta-lactamase [Acidobacteriota bacterium]